MLQTGDWFISVPVGLFSQPPGQQFMMVVRTTAVVVQKHCQCVYSVLTSTANGKPFANQILRLVTTYAISFIRLIGYGNLRRIKTLNCLGLVLRSRPGTSEN